MADQAAPASTQANGAAAEPAPPAEGTAAELATFVKSFESWKASINNQLARIRKGSAPDADGKGPDGKAREGEVREDKTTTPALTRDDVKAALEVGKLQASLSAEALAEIEPEIEGLPFVEQARILRIAAKAAAKSEARPERASDHRPERAETRRATAAASRETVSRPETLADYVELAAKDPKRKAALDADPTFDPSELPRRR